MQRVAGIDSIVMQIKTGDGDLRTAEKLAEVLNGKLELIRSPPVRPTKNGIRSWRYLTGRRFPKTAAFVALLHHGRGQSIPLVRYGASKGLEAHFHGLKQYSKDTAVLSDGAIQRGKILQELIEKWNNPIKIIRFDRCIDFIGMTWKSYPNNRLHRALSKKHGAALFETSTLYYQPFKPQHYVKVIGYDKQSSNKLNFEIVRVEFQFMGQYWKKIGAIMPTDLIGLATSKADSFIQKMS